MVSSSLERVEALTITIVRDDRRDGLSSSPPFGCVLEADGNTVLFDASPDAILLGGASSNLPSQPSTPLIIDSRSTELASCDGLRRFGPQREPIQVTRGIWASGSVPGSTEAEQVAIVSHLDGLWLVLGGRLRDAAMTVEHVRLMFPEEPIVGVVGGLLQERGDGPWFERLASTLEESDVCVVAPGAVAGPLAKWALRRRFAERYQEVGPGTCLHVDAWGRLEVLNAPTPEPDSSRLVPSSATRSERASTRPLEGFGQGFHLHPPKDEVDGA